MRGAAATIVLAASALAAACASNPETRRSEPTTVVVEVLNNGSPPTRLRVSIHPSVGRGASLGVVPVGETRAFYYRVRRFGGFRLRASELAPGGAGLDPDNPLAASAVVVSDPFQIRAGVERITWHLASNAVWAQ